MGILICGLNGAGKSTIGKVLANRMGYEFIDNEDLFFPKSDSSYEFAIQRRSKITYLCRLEGGFLYYL